jgi:UDP-2,3-diacylglucosamine pyrophosphatase LpxH
MNMMPLPERVTRYRTIFISDVHLGTRGCKAEFLVDFLRNTDSEKLYLVGDIIDGWRLKKIWYWRTAFNDVVQEVLQKVQNGTQVVYIPGNHDEIARGYIGLEVGGVEIRRDDIHETADGRRFLVLHGDEFDGVVRNAKWLAMLGDWAYNGAQWVNSVFNWGRRLLGLHYWSLSAFLKTKVKGAFNYINKFETLVADTAEKRGVEGVICGHIHHAQIRRIGDVLYCNDGDWVESCTALVEDMDGQLTILNWAQISHGRIPPAPSWRKEPGAPPPRLPELVE